MHKRGIVNVTVDTNSLRAMLKTKSMPPSFYDKIDTSLEAFIEMRSSVMQDEDLYDGLSGIINIIDAVLKKTKG
jgi:hypothetical protein